MRAKLKQKPPPVRFHQYGGVPGRRREEAIAVAHNCKMRALRSKKTHVQTFRDAAGAYNSITHGAICKNLLNHMSLHEMRLFLHTHKDAHLWLEGHGLYKIKKGTLPGHSIGGDIFNSVYAEAIDGYLTSKNKGEEVIQYEGKEVDA